MIKNNSKKRRASHVHRIIIDEKVEILSTELIDPDIEAWLLGCRFLLGRTLMI